MRDHVAAAPVGSTVGQPLLSVLLVPTVTGVAVAGPPFVLFPICTNGKKQIGLGAVLASPSIWKIKFLSSTWANAACGSMITAAIASRLQVRKSRLQQHVRKLIIFSSSEIGYTGLRLWLDSCLLEDRS